MKIPDGLYFYEFILLILGVLFFVALLIALLFRLFKNQDLGSLLPFFILPVVMIGFPGIQKISFDKGVLSIEKYVREASQDSTKNAARMNLTRVMAKIGDRPSNTPATLLKFSRAQAILGDTLKAYNYSEKALTLSPYSMEAIYLQAQFNTTQVQVEKNIIDLMNDPTDIKKKRALELNMKSLNTTSGANTSVLTTAAKANEALGDTAKALSLAKNAVAKDKSNIEAANIVTRLRK